MANDETMRIIAEELTAAGLEAVYTPEAVALLDARANALADEAGALKVKEAKRAVRKAKKVEVDRVLLAKGYLIALRGPQAGDVGAGPGPVGSA